MHGIFDSHAHYAGEEFDEDRDALLTELPERGIEYIMLASAALEDSVKNSQIAKKYGYIYSAAGVHPENESVTPPDFEDKIGEIVLGNEKVRAVGEIGLDYHYEGFNRERQIRLFTRQLELAAELDRPVIVHSRDATEDTLNILRKYKPHGVVHCFSGSPETAAEILKLGMYIGFTGVITFKNARRSLEALASIPTDRLLIETDCPYMAPVPFRGKRCDSSMLTYTAAKAAMRLFGINED